MRFLREHDAAIPVAELLYSDVAGDAFEIPYSIWRFVEGDLLQTLLPTLSTAEAGQVAAACGQVLAGFTAFPFERSGEFGPELSLQHEFGAPSRFVPVAIENALFRGRAGARLGASLCEALWATVQRTGPELTQIDDRYCLVHSDYKRSNLLLRRAGNRFEVAAVLDWEFACSGPPLVDVGIFLRAGEALPAGFRDAFVTAYRDGGGWVPKDWLRLSRLVDLISQVTFLDSEVERPRVFAESIGVIEETLRVLD
jgi:aminoglycoside phosphotransferase (APT) family kinase protein